MGSKILVSGLGPGQGSQYVQKRNLSVQPVGRKKTHKTETLSLCACLVQAPSANLLFTEILLCVRVEKYQYLNQRLVDIILAWQRSRLAGRISSLLFAWTY